MPEIRPEQHGTRHGYVHFKCRCAACRKANADYQVVTSRRRAERLASGEGSPAHGTAATYANWACRCDACAHAAAAARRRRRGCL